MSAVSSHDAEALSSNQWEPAPTFGGAAYWDPAIFEAERQRLFFTEWFCIGREEEIVEPSGYLAVDVAGESIVVTRNRVGALRAFYNVCRHRGTKLCDDGPGSAKSGVFKCPYHAWTYTTDGNLVGTPNVTAAEGLDRSSYPLWQVAVDTWDGFLFVNLSDDPPPLAQAIANDPDDPGQFARFGLRDLRIGVARTFEVRANWKILIENYKECLHCPQVHPELVSLIPVYRKGRVDEDPYSWGVHLAEGATSFTLDGTSKLPRLPGIADEDAQLYFGAHLFPNMFLDLTSDCVIASYLHPKTPDLTLIVEQFLFRPDTIADPSFDPSPVVEFETLVSSQDTVVCEREQLGVRSRAYDSGGIYPHADRFVYAFNELYRARMGRTGPPTDTRAGSVVRSEI